MCLSVGSAEGRRLEHRSAVIGWFGWRPPAVMKTVASVPMKRAMEQDDFFCDG
jgi:hypothetical protein